jgi:HlyD family secretion protein
MQLPKKRFGKVLLSSFAVVAVIPVGLTVLALQKDTAPKAHAEVSRNNGHHEAEALYVKVVAPKAGGIERSTVQPGTLRAFEYQEVRPKVSGFLNKVVDIDTVVHKGDVLAEISAPELLKEELHAQAALKQAEAQVRQMMAHVDAAKAEMDAAKQLIPQRQAEAKRAESDLKYRSSQAKRFEELVSSKAIDYRLRDEQIERLESSQAWTDAAAASVETAKAEVKSKEAKVIQAQADLDAAKSNVDVARATLEKAQVFVEYTKVRSGYDGVVTARNYHNGDFVSSADRGTSESPLFVVQRTDLMRLVVQVPDQDAPFCKPGNPVTFSTTTLPNVEFPAYKISRVARSQDLRSRTMRVEADVPNPDGNLRDGMYGDVTILLQPASAKVLRVPMSAVRREKRRGVVFVVRGETVHAVQVQTGADNGSDVEILSGLQADDRVVADAAAQIQDGVQVRVAESGGTQRASSH